MRLPGQKTLVQAGRWLRSRLLRGGLILGYHRVADPRADPYGVCVSPAHFAEQLEVIRRLCQPLPLTEFVQRLAAGRLPAGAVALTFDDGYVDFLDQALACLQQHSIPATVFVVTGGLGQAFWWDELAETLLRGERADPPETSQRRVTEAYQRLLRLPAAEREAALSQLRARAGDRPAASAASRSLTAAEIQQLANTQVEIGSHTVTHPRLADLPLACQRSEIAGSQAALEELLGRPVTGFSYPNGSVGSQTPALVQEAGFAYACGSQPDVALRASHPYHLPRFWVPDCDGDAFARWLRVWQRG